MNWSPLIMPLLLISVNTWSKAEIGLPVHCKNMTPGKPNTLYKKKPIYWSKNVRHKTVLPKISSIKSSTENEKIEELKRKSMHGQCCWDLERPSVDKEKSLVWSCRWGLKGEMESSIIIIIIIIIIGQGQALNTRYHQRNMNQPTDSKCRMRPKAERISDVAGCTTPAPCEYTNTVFLNLCETAAR